MCIFHRGLLSKTEGDSMPSQTGHHGGGWQLYPNQPFLPEPWGFLGLGKIKGVKEKVLSCSRGLFQILSSICFSRELLFLCTMAIVLTHAHGEMQTGVCNLMDPTIIWDKSSIVNPQTIGLCPCSSTEQLPMKWVNSSIPHFHLNVENPSPDPLGRPICSRVNVKVVVTVLVIIGGIGIAGRMLYKRCRSFTEADINRGLRSEPAVPRRSNPTFEIPLHIDGIAI